MTAERVKEIREILRKNNISDGEIYNLVNHNKRLKFRTIEQWLKEYLSEEEYNNAKYNRFDAEWETTTVSNLSSALNEFDWSRMPEGYAYWENKYDCLGRANL